MTSAKPELRTTGPPKRLPQVPRQLGAGVGQDAEVGEAQVADAVDERLVGGAGLGLVLLEDALDVVGGADADADAVGADRLGHGAGDLDARRARFSGEPP